MDTLQILVKAALNAESAMNTLRQAWEYAEAEHLQLWRVYCEATGIVGDDDEEKAIYPTVAYAVADEMWQAILAAEAKAKAAWDAYAAVADVIAEAKQAAHNLEVKGRIASINRKGLQFEEVE